MRWLDRVGAIRFVELGAADVACSVDRAALLPTSRVMEDSRM